MIKLTIPSFWHKSINYGDKLTPYLIEKISGYKTVFLPEEDESPKIVAIGSILGANCTNAVIWGAGFAWHKEYEHEEVTKPIHITAVRGKLTREKFMHHKIDCPEVYGDPALLLPKYYNPPTEKQYAIGIIPHIIDLEKVREMYPKEELEKHNAIIIDLRGEVEEVTRAIMSCKKTISSSLHGLVVSHAYGIDSLWVEFSYNVIGQGFKFRDYFSSVNITPYEPLNLLKYQPINNVIKQVPNHKIDINLNKLLDAFPVISKD